MQQKLRKYWKDIQMDIENSFVEFVMVVVAAIICIYDYIYNDLPPYTNVFALIFILIFAIIGRRKQAEKSESNKAIKTLKNRLEDFRKEFLNRGESDSFFSLSGKTPPKEEYHIELWNKYHDCKFGRLTLEVDYIDRQITGSILNKQEIRRCFIDLFNTTKRLYAFLDEYVSEINEQGNLTVEREKIVSVIVSVYNDFIKDLNKDVRSLDIDVAGIQLSKITL